MQAIDPGYYSTKEQLRANLVQQIGENDEIVAHSQWSLRMFGQERKFETRANITLGINFERWWDDYGKDGNVVTVFYKVSPQ